MSDQPQINGKGPGPGRTSSSHDLVDRFIQRDIAVFQIYLYHHRHAYLETRYPNAEIATDVGAILPRAAHGLRRLTEGTPTMLTIFMRGSN